MATADHRKTSRRLPAPSSSSARNPSSTAPLRTRGLSRMTSDEVLQIAYGVPTLQPTADTRNPTNNTSPSQNTTLRLGHGRSSSQPFPMLFSSKKKSHENAALGSLDPTDANDFNLSTQSPYKQNAGNSDKGSEQETIQGKCMTCNSGVRWPKGLTVFRCTVCQTINDLKSLGLDKSSPHWQQVPAVIPLSIQRTKTIIDHCTRLFLKSRLEFREEILPAERPSVNTQPIVPSQIGDDGQVKEGIFSSLNPLNTSTHESGPQLAQPIAVSSTAARLPKIYCETGNLISDSSRLYSRSTPSAGAYESRNHLMSQSPITAVDLSVAPTRTAPLPPKSKQIRVESNVHAQEGEIQSKSDDHKRIFKALEDYIITAFRYKECINSSFTTHRSNMPPRSASQDAVRESSPSTIPRNDLKGDLLSTLDHKTLLLGGFAENGFWWTGNESSLKQNEKSHLEHRHGKNDDAHPPTIVSIRSPRIDWAAVTEWYRLTTEAGLGWEAVLDHLRADENSLLAPRQLSVADMQALEAAFGDGRKHIQRVLLKVTENLLKRPGSLLRTPDDIRFLLILWSNPLLYPSSKATRSDHRSQARSLLKPGSFRERSRSRSRDQQHISLRTSKTAQGRTQDSEQAPEASQQCADVGPGQHSGIIKRILGLLSHLDDECHSHLISWFSRFSETHFRLLTELIGSFVTYRLTRQQGRQPKARQDMTGGLVPSMTVTGQGSSAALHAALGAAAQPPKKTEKKHKAVVYQDDWQVRAAARVMQLLSTANNNAPLHRSSLAMTELGGLSGNVTVAARERAHRHGQILATSDFYNTLLDYSDYISDFETWETRGASKFTFCQYPFFISIGTKIKILEYDARRQQEIKAREAFFDSIMTRKELSGHLTLSIRRECLVEDSLKGVSEVVGASNEEIKKRLRIVFKGEEGLDAGGLRKEWFLLLVREVFNPEHGMFVYDEDSQFCYFNPHSFETSDQFYLVGVVLGLAIYNSTILDIALPPFAFKKLMASGPASTNGTIARLRSTMTYTLDDLAEWRPSLASGLRQLLDYDGDVETTFCRDFVVDIDRYGQVVQIPLCTGGENRPVTNANRREFVNLYVKYILDTSVVRQFEPFKRGFWQVCAGNALSLFQPEEIELLVRGSEEALDINTMKGVATYDNWSKQASEPTIDWFWNTFGSADPGKQRKLLSFITGSDRIPATGAANLIIKISCGGDHPDRYPQARTCFNQLVLPRYDSRERLQTMLWTAVYESAGFGLK